MAKKSEDSVLTDHDAYLGTDPIYKSAADVTQEPQTIEGDEEAGVLDADLSSELVDRVKENEENLAKGVNQWGSGYDVAHPTEQVSASDKRIADQKAVLQAQVDAAKQPAPQAPQAPQAKEASKE